MPRKGKPDETAMSGDKVSPDTAPGTVTKPRKTRAAKVDRTAAPVSKPKTAAKKPLARTAPAPQPAAQEAGKRSTAPEGNTTLKNPIDLTPKQQEAMETAALMGLDARQARFVDLWLVSYNGAQAYRDAGYKAKNDNVAAVGASKLLRKVKHHPYTLARQAELFQRTADIQNEILSVVRAAAFADPRELVEYVRRCCRYCYGKSFKYQFKPSEMERRQDEYDEKLGEAEAQGKTLPPFDELGGLGFDSTKPPHPNCPECSGEGFGHALFKDTSNLTPAALALFEGVKEGKDGTEIKVASQRGYRELLANIYDLSVEPTVIVNTGVSQEELEQTLAKAEAKTNAERQAMIEREALLAAGGEL